MFILLVEDDLADVELVREALAELDSDTAIDLQSISDGDVALAYLRQEQGPTRRPDLIFLDLNMPRRSGREVLTAIKRDPDLKSIPVVILTTSAAESDINAAYRLGANCYITKPQDLESFERSLAVTVAFWNQVAQLPD